MKYLSLIVSLLGLCSCSRAPTLLVTVADLPPAAQSLQVLTAHMGMAAVADLDPYDLPSPGATMPPTFLLRLPTGFSGDITVNVGAFMSTGAQGCLVGAGSANTMMFNGPDDKLTVAMMPASDTACSGSKVLLTTATPALGSTKGGDKITLTGWGFKPGAKIYFGSTVATTVTYVSAAQVQVVTPAKAGFGPTPIKIVNPDNTTVSRSDLFRFFADVVDFTPLAFPQPGDYSNVNGFAFGIFNPATSLDAAAVTPGNDYVRVVFTTNATSISHTDYNLPANSTPTGLAIADFNKDGALDIVVNTQTTTPPMAAIFLNNGSGVFAAAGSVPVGMQPDAMVTADFNADGFPDVVIANRMDSTLSVAMGDGKGGFKSAAQTINLKGKADPISVAVSDFNSDGQLDILYADSKTGNVVVIQNQNGDFNALTQIGPFNIGPSIASLVSMDINGDGKADVITSDPSSGQLVVIENRGGANILPYSVPTEALPQIVWVADMNGDGYLDLVVPSKGASTVDILLNNGGTGFKGVTYKSFNSMCPMPVQIAIYDIDRDGRPDIGVLCSTGIGLLINHSGL